MALFPSRPGNGTNDTNRGDPVLGRLQFEPSIEGERYLDGVVGVEGSSDARLADVRAGSENPKCSATGRSRGRVIWRRVDVEHEGHSGSRDCGGESSRSVRKPSATLISRAKSEAQSSLTGAGERLSPRMWISFTSVAVVAVHFPKSRRATHLRIERIAERASEPKAAEFELPRAAPIKPC